MTTIIVLPLSTLLVQLFRLSAPRVISLDDDNDEEENGVDEDTVIRQLMSFQGDKPKISFSNYNDSRALILDEISKEEESESEYM